MEYNGFVQSVFRSKELFTDEGSKTLSMHKITNNKSMKSIIIRPATAQRLSYVYYFSDPTTVTLQEVIEWFEKVHNIQIIDIMDEWLGNKRKCWCCYVLELNNFGKITPAERIPNFPYRSTKYNLRNDRLEDGINHAITLIDNTLFDAI